MSTVFPITVGDKKYSPVFKRLMTTPASSKACWPRRIRMDRRRAYAKAQSSGSGSSQSNLDGAQTNTP